MSAAESDAGMSDAESDGGPPLELLELLELPHALIAHALAYAPPAELALARRACKICRDTHVPEAERLIVRRLDAAVALFRHTMCAGPWHTVCVDPAGGALSWGGSSSTLAHLGQGGAIPRALGVCQLRGELCRAPLEFCRDLLLRQLG